MAEAADRLKAKGYEWAALELDDAETRPVNVAIWPDFCIEFRARGMMAGAWFTEGGSIYLTPPDSDFAIAEIEGPGDYDGVVNLLNGQGGGPMPKCSLATVTNFSTITRDKAKVLIDAGFTCLPEAYTNENPRATPDSVDRIARNLGWPTSQPVAGVYPNPTTGVVYDYSQWANWPLCDYLGEYVI